MREFVKEPHIVALAAWSHHARLMVKNGDSIHIYDPWQQNPRPPEWVKTGTQDEQGTTLFKLITKKRNADQAFGERSCQLQALTRMLMVALYGEEDAFSPFTTKDPERLAVPVAVQLLVSRLKMRY